MMKKFFALITILRPVNFALTFFSVFAAGLICQTTKEITSSILLASVSAALVSGGGNVINDYFDVEIDKVNRPDRVLPSGIFSRAFVLIYYSLLTLTALFFASFINQAAFIIAAAAAVSIFVYSIKLKSVPLAGNFIVAFLTGFAFIYGGVAAGNWKQGIFPAVFAFLINFMRELTKDIEDIKGDSAEGARTFPIVYGIKRTKSVIVILSAALIVSTFIPFYLSIYNIEYFILVLFSVNLLVIYSDKKLLSAEVKNEYHKISSLMKLSMGFGLISIFIGTL